MKCKYCNAEVAPNARFCTTCGGDLSKLDKCVNCGEFIEKAESVCPHCGTEQPVRLAEAKTSSRKWLWVILSLILLAAIIGGGYYFYDMNSGNKMLVTESDSTIIEVDGEMGDIHSIEGVKARLEEILSKGMGMSDEEAVKKYFSKDYQEAFHKVEEYDKKYIPEGMIGFWEESIWADGQGGIGNFHSVIKDVQNITEKKVSAIVEYVSDDYKGEKLTTMFDLCFENGNWYIDEIKNDGGFVYKKEMKEYIEYWQKKQLFIDAYSKVLGDYVKKGKNDTLYGNFYFLHDITGDGFSELWIQVEGEGDDNLNCQLLIYEYKNGAVSKIYQKSVGHPAHHSYILLNNNIYMSFEHMGDSQLEKFEYKNGIIQSTMGTSQEVSDYEKSKGQDVETYKMTNKESLSYI